MFDLDNANGSDEKFPDGQPPLEKVSNLLHKACLSYSNKWLLSILAKDQTSVSEKKYS